MWKRYKKKRRWKRFHKKIQPKIDDIETVWQKWITEKK